MQMRRPVERAIEKAISKKISGTMEKPMEKPTSRERLGLGGRLVGLLVVVVLWLLLSLGI